MGFPRKWIFGVVEVCFQSEPVWNWNFFTFPLNGECSRCFQGRETDTVNQHRRSEQQPPKPSVPAPGGVPVSPVRGDPAGDGALRQGWMTRCCPQTRRVRAWTRDLSPTYHISKKRRGALWIGIFQLTRTHSKQQFHLPGGRKTQLGAMRSHKQPITPVLTAARLVGATVDTTTRVTLLQKTLQFPQDSFLFS